MDTFEEYYVQQEKQTREGTRIKTSPFADSPYETPFDNLVENVPTTATDVPKRSVGKRVLAVICVVALLVVCCGATVLVANHTYENRLEQAQSAMEQKLSKMQQQLDELKKQNAAVVPTNIPAEGMSPGQVFAAVESSVVCVMAMGTDGSGSSGSGFIYTEDGYVITNYHVVAEMSELTVILNDKTELEATLVGKDASADIAVLKVEAEKLPCVTLGSSDALRVGEQVVAIGYPLSSDTASMTVGYISAKDQVVSTDGSVANMLQTDAAINSGNSGGPLFNSAGQVIGITTAKFSGYSSSGVSIEGMGFAIPIDDVLGMIEDLREYGYVTGAYLGVYVRDVDSYVQEYGLPAGAYVDEATAGFAAEEAGIKAGDVIIALEGNDITSVSDLTLALRRFNAGDKVSVVVWRGGKEIQLTVVLDEKPIEDPAQTPEATVPQEEQELPQYDEQIPWEDWLAPFFGMFPDMGG